MKAKFSLIKIKRGAVILAVLTMLVCHGPIAEAQIKKPPKVTEAFLAFVSKELELTSVESVEMEPLVKQYLAERGKTARAFRDPLEREQQILAVKMKYRPLMAKIIGLQRATRFFTSEQSFRRKAKEVLKQREQREKNN